MDDPLDLAERTFAELGLSEKQREALRAIRRELDASYRERFTELASAINRQSSALDRMQRTLELLVRAVQPSLTADLPPALRIADVGEAPDLASAIVLADPVAAGYTLTQADIARALGLTGPEVSVLIRAFKLDKDEFLSVAIHRGRQVVVNYKRDAVEKFCAMLETPPKGLTSAQRMHLERARRRLKIGPPAK